MTFNYQSIELFERKKLFKKTTYHQQRKDWERWESALIIVLTVLDNKKKSISEREAIKEMLEVSHFSITFAEVNNLRYAHVVNIPNILNELLN